MKIYEKVKEMSMDEMLAFLKLLSADGDNIYCNYICDNRQHEDICDLQDCTVIDELKEVLNADYSIIEGIIDHLEKEV